MFDKLSYDLDNILECVSVQVLISHTKRMIISCLCSQPNGEIETSIDVINKMFMNKQSNIFMCGNVYGWNLLYVI